MSTAARLVKLVEGLDADGVLSATKGGTGNTTGGGTSSPTISQIAYSGDDTAANPAGGQTITLTGTNFAAGAKVLINTTQVSVVTVVSATQITFTAPALAAGSYILYVVNTNGSTAIAVPGIQVSGVPAWTTAAGTLGTVYETAAVSATVAATSDSAVTYSLASGTLPTGVTFNSNGTISGTSVLTASSTTYTFTIKATDAENQDTDRSFSLTINPDVVSWSSPANSAALTGAPGVAYSSALVATSAAGKSITYSADALPAGLSISGATITGTPTTAGTSSSTLTATAATTNRTAQVTISWTITVAADTYFPYTTLLLNSETTTTPFTTDASVNSFAVTANGNAKPSNFNPYTPGYYSNYFAGDTNDYLTVSAASSQLNLPGDFTVECWIYDTGSGGLGQFAWSTSGGFACGINAVDGGSTRKLDWRASGSAPVWGVTAITQNTWHHVAYVRSGSAFRIFLNGKLEYYNANLTTAYSSTSTNIGAKGGEAGYAFKGYISNFRVVKGTAVYTTSSTSVGAQVFTPDTAVLTAITNTALLTCRSNRFIDASTNALSITRTNNVTVSSFDPFVPDANYATYGSTYLNGTTDYLTVPQNAAFNFGTGDFTVEGWWNFTSIATSQGLISLGTGANGGGPYNGWWFDYESSGILRFYRYAGGSEIYSSFSVTLVPGTWYHIACTRSGTAVKMFVNGVQVGTTATSSTSFDNVNSDPLVIGRFITGQGTFYLNGYVSDVRITKGTALYTANFTPPTTPLTAVSGTSLLTCQTNQPVNNQTFLDNSTSALPITYVGSATQGSFSPYGANWSNYFAGSTSDYLTIPTTSGALDHTGDFTTELWIYWNSMPTGSTYENIYSAPGSTSGLYMLGTSNSSTVWAPPYILRLYISGTGDVINGNTVLTAGQWYHIAHTRASGVNRLFVNGVLQTNTYTDSTSRVLGANGIVIAKNSNAYVSNVRYVKGTALYTTTFTPSTEPLTAVTGTSLLTCQSPNIIDNSANALAVTAAGATSTQKFSPFATVTQTPQSYSTYFDGSGDYLSLGDQTAFEFGSDNYTVEFWWYATTSADQNLIGKWVDSSGSEWILQWRNAGYFRWAVNGGVSSDATTSLLLNRWSHIAVSKSGTSLRIFYNGTQINTTATEGTISATSSSLTIGTSQLNTSPNWTFGHISNVRIVKGTALYTANFTPATAPLTAISGTSLLTAKTQLLKTIVLTTLL